MDGLVNARAVRGIADADRTLDARLRGLTGAAAAERAARLSLVLTDCDGVLTDGSVFCSADGEALLRFSRRDGMAVERLRAAGLETAIVTRERSPIVARRAEKLGVHVYAGIRDKRDWLLGWLVEQDPRWNQGNEALASLAYIGDDVNDLGLCAAVAPHGLTGAPADAEPVVRGDDSVHFVGARPGGAGAFREFADFLIGLRGVWGERVATERRTP